MTQEKAQKLKLFIKESYPIFLILALASFLRFFGLRWGLPNHLHDYSYHPDEFLTVGASFFNVFMKGSIDPGFYNYPSLYLYVSALFSAVGVGYGIKPTPENIYLFARVATAVMGVCSIWATYWAGCKLFNKNAGLAAAFILTILPLHIQHSHFATVDVPCTLFIALTLGFCGLIISRGSLKDYIFAGVMCGFAAGTKYNAGLVFLSIIAAFIITLLQNKTSDNIDNNLDGAKVAPSTTMSFPRKRESRKQIQSNSNNNFLSSNFLKIAAVFIFTIVGFVVSTPGSVLSTSEFLHGITYELNHTSTGHGLVFLGTGNGLIFNLHNLSFGIGSSILYAFIFTVIFSIIRKDRKTIILLAFIIPYYVLISLSQVRFARYTLPMFPAIAIMCSCVFFYAEKNKWSKTFKVIFFTILALSFVFSNDFNIITIEKLFARTDVRDRAAEWVFANVQKDDSIGMVDAPWFYSPPLSKMFGYGTLDLRIEQAKKTPYKIGIVSTGYDWTKNPSKWVILTDYETEDAKRLKDKNINSFLNNDIIRINKFVSFVEANYNKKKAFTNGVDNLPHDMKYVSPSITIYELRK